MKQLPGALLIAGVCLLLAACNNDSGVNPPDSTGAAKVVEARTSECHGFILGKRAEDGQDEMLNWSYDAESETLHLHHAALILNCCGVHTIDASYENGIVTVFEDDQPEPEGGRCHCICPFDFIVVLEGIPVAVTGLRIELTVDDTTTEHWAGAIDLAEGAGEVVIREQTLLSYD